MFGSTPDLITTVEDEIAIGGIYTSTWTMRGIFIADPSDPVNSGVPYEAKRMSIIKFRDNSTDLYYQRDSYVPRLRVDERLCPTGSASLR